jgi:glucosyl-3-phosphoglycerate synthase
MPIPVEPAVVDPAVGDPALVDPALNAGSPVLTHRHSDFVASDLVSAKAGARVTVCIPARDEERTIGAIVTAVRSDLVEALPLVDEVIVVNDGSSDATAAEAQRCGAIVLHGPGVGKGEAMRLARGRGDYVVFLDGDVENFGSHFVTGLLGTLLSDERIVLVKGSYARPLSGSGAGGGRVTELVAKPLISLMFPELAGVTQPLAGETAVRSQVLDKVELSGGYGVEMGLLLDTWSIWGVEAIAQVELGERRHRNRPLAELGAQAREVIAAALERAGLAGIASS